MRRSQLMWGVVFIFIGVFLLVNAMGLKLPNGKPLLDIFWPTLLIILGIWVLAEVFFSKKADVENASIDLQSASSANIILSHGAGELKIHGGATANEIAHGSFVGGLEQIANRNGDKLEVQMRPARDFLDFPFFSSITQLDWDVALNTEIPIALKLKLGANKSELDFRGMNITHLDLDTGASDTTIYLPPRGRFVADLDLGAASLAVIVPEGLSARIRVSLGAADFQIDEIRFPYNGGFYQSADYDSAPSAVDMTIDAGAASVQVK